ncbi:sensor histidine kinase [Herbidospora mongoliensis]|uniref:sensor histidine kinase n=1 Tax=Herbidospora mongoliensis TaxID=688067 RepID=UPI0014714468|nr:histidine kinase [Herbidospora mongoliensis]
MARAVIGVVLFAYTFNALMFVWGEDLRGPPLAAFAACLLTGLGLQLVHSTRDVLFWSPPKKALSLMAQAAVMFAPFAWVGPQAGSVAGFLAGSMLLAVPGPLRWALYAAVPAAIFAVLTVLGMAPLDVVYGAYFTALTGLMVYGLSSLASLAQTVHAARGELAGVAVAQERLRVARDVHDLLGYNVSALTLKSELAYRLLPGAADRARRELRDVLTLSRQALGDVRVVAGGSRPMSLAAEVRSAESMLIAADMDVEIALSPCPLPEEVDTVLAIVLREAVTNVLRHSKAQHCLVETALAGDRIVLRVVNDGPDLPAEDLDGGAGLDNLSARVEAAGGTSTTVQDDEWFTFTAEVPIAQPVVEDPVTRTFAQITAQPWHLRVARTIAVVVLLGYGVLMVVNVLAQGPGSLGLLEFALCVAVLVGVQIALALGFHLRGFALPAQAVATYLPLLWIGDPWGSMGGFLAGTALIVLSGAWRWCCYAAVGVSVAALSVLNGDAGEWTVYLTLSTLLTGLVVYGISSLTGLVAQVDQARDDLARGAVTRERLRVARELHDLLGNDLADMTVKSERAYRLLPGSVDRARAELAEVLDVARRAVADVRSVASGYRHMSFTAELDSARATMTAAGVCVQVRSGEPSGEVDALLAVVLREAVTNVLRHSAATRCEIVLTPPATLTVWNDGVPASAPPGEPGTALDDLAERLKSVGGSLKCERDSGAFLLKVDIP